MWIVLSIILWLLAGAVVLLLGALLLPVRLRFSLRSAPQLSYRMAVQPFGGLVPPLPVFDSEREQKKQKKRKEASKPKKKQAGRSFIKPRHALKAAPDLVADLLRTIHFEYLNVDGTFGLEDPAETGQLYGRLTPFIYGLPQLPGISIFVRPDFENARLSGEMDTAVHITPAALLPPAMRFAWRASGR